MHTPAGLVVQSLETHIVFMKIIQSFMNYVTPSARVL